MYVSLLAPLINSVVIDAAWVEGDTTALNARGHVSDGSGGSAGHAPVKPVSHKTQIGLSDLGGPVTFRFGILEPVNGTGCTTHMHTRIMEELRRHPHFVKDVKHADLVFVNIDTMLQIMWPERGDRFVTSPDDDPASAYAANYEGTCVWQDWNTVYDYVQTVKEYKKKCPQCINRQKFAYFHSPNYWNLNESDTPNIRSHLHGFDVLFIGLDITKQDATDVDINMLMPLLNEEAEMQPPHKKDLCAARENKVCFIGANSSPIRADIFGIWSNKEDMGYYIAQTAKWTKDNSTGYRTILKSCDFGLSPRGDTHYSFRTTELLNMGVIPVIFDDQQKDPYNVPLKEWAIRVPEKDIYQLDEIISKFSKKQICQLKKNGQKMLKFGRELEPAVRATLSSIGMSLKASKTKRSLAQLGAQDSGNPISKKDLTKYINAEEHNHRGIHHVSAENAPSYRPAFDMGTYFVSLPERMKYVKKFINDNKIPDALLFEAVTDANPKTMQRKGLIVKGNVDGPLEHGEIGCTLSHRKVLESFLASDHEYAMVFEDDSAWDPASFKRWGLHPHGKEKSMVHQLAEKLVGGAEFDLLNLGRCFDMCATQKILNITKTGGMIVSSQLPLCTNAYLTTRTGARKMLDNGMPLKYAEDVARVNIMMKDKDFKYVSASPRLFYQVQHEGSDSIHISKDLVECRNDNTYKFARKQYAAVLEPCSAGDYQCEAGCDPAYDFMCDNDGLIKSPNLVEV